MTAITHARQTLYNCYHFILCFDKLSPNGRAFQCSSYYCRLPSSRRRRNSLAGSVVNNLNRLPFSVASVKEQRKFKQLLDSYVYSQFFLFILFSPQYSLFGHFFSSRSVNTYITGDSVKRCIENISSQYIFYMHKIQHLLSLKELFKALRNYLKGR